MKVIRFLFLLIRKAWWIFLYGLLSVVKTLFWLGTLALFGGALVVWGYTGYGIWNGAPLLISILPFAGGVGLLVLGLACLAYVTGWDTVKNSVGPYPL